MEFEMVEESGARPSGTVIKVVGVGGAGGNAVHHMIESGVQGVEFIVANTDAQALDQSLAHKVIQLGDSGLGAGCNPDMGKTCAEQARDRIREALQGAHMVFVTAGMGGGTGTGASPIIAEVAKEIGALTVGVVTKPFSYERTQTATVADNGIEELSKKCDSLIVILNEKLEEIYEDATFDEWMSHADAVLNNAVSGIAEIINVAGHINVDFNDVKAIMGDQGKAMMGTAVASGADRALVAAQQAIASPLLEGVDLKGARGVLVNITAAKTTLKGKEVKTIMETVTACAAENALVIKGVAYDDEMGEDVRVTVVVTGLGKTRAKPQIVSSNQQSQWLRTGTDNIPVLGAGQMLPPGAGVPQGQPMGTAGQMPMGQMGQAAAAPTAPASGYDAFDTPTVFRNPRENAAKVQALESHGMETLDIPAFLRKQAD